MVAALFEIRGWAGIDKYLFTGRSAASILTKLNQVQDLDCLISMGKFEEGPLGRQAISRLEEIIKKKQASKLTLQDFDGMFISLKAGSLKCVETADGQEAVDAMKAAHPDAYLR